MHKAEFDDVYRVHGNRARTLFNEGKPLTCTDGFIRPIFTPDSGYTKNYTTFDQWANECAYYATHTVVWWALKD